jgi:hypothetical protein
MIAKLPAGDVINLWLHMTGRFATYFARPTGRSAFTATGVAYIKEEHVREWFDDLVEAQFWLQGLSSRCGESQIARVRDGSRWSE